MIRKLSGILVLVASLGAASNAVAHTTECDWVAGHPTEPERQAPGPSRVNYKGALFACERDLAADPDNLHLKYTLGHMLYYKSPVQDQERSIALVMEAAEKGYAQAQFAIGLFYMNEKYGVGHILPPDDCKGAYWHLKAARWGRYASLIAYSRWAIKGRYDKCEEKVDWNEVAGFLDLARGAAQYDFYDGLLVDDLEEQLAEKVAASK